MNLIYASLVTMGAACVLLTACGPESTMKMYEQTQRATDVPIQDDNRVQVTRIGVFDDNLAYGGSRGVYIIKDRKTGKEYVGISGIGISETGSHSNGKTSTTDER